MVMLAGCAMRTSRSMRGHRRPLRMKSIRGQVPLPRAAGPWVAGTLLTVEMLPAQGLKAREARSPVDGA